MFAFAVWDRKKRILSLARDRMGEKPLYYGWQGSGKERTFLFGSELKALRQHPAWQGGVDRDALADLLRYNDVPAPQTIHPGIYKLLPGHLLHLSQQDGGWSERDESWWSLLEVSQQAQSTPYRWSREDAVEQLDDLLRKVIQGQRLADVPLGAFLSGGVDSSSVVGVMQSLTGQPVRSFTIGFENPAYDESPNARAVANHLGTEHHEWIVTAKDALSIIPDLPIVYDEPFADVSQIPTLLVSQLAKQKVTVSLSGDGGDELFAGYNRHQWGARIWNNMRHIPGWIRKALSLLIASPSPQGWDHFFRMIDPLLPQYLRVRHAGEKIHKIALLLKSAGERELYMNLLQIWPGSPPVLGSKAHDLVNDHQPLWEMGEHFSERMSRLDSVTYLPDDILVKIDRAAMRNSLETRVPLLDHRVVEFAAQLPISMKIHKGSGKWILREVLDRYVPRELVDCPKSGFAIPVDDWLRGPLRGWAEDLLSIERLKSEEYFDWNTVRMAWEQHLSGKKNMQYPLWGVLMFQAWNL